MINLKLSPFPCNNPSFLLMCNNSNEETPKSCFFSVKETPEFDGDIVIDHDLKLDEENKYIKEYFTWIKYTPSSENSEEVHINDLNKLKDLIGKALAGDM